MPTCAGDGPHLAVRMLGRPMMAIRCGLAVAAVMLAVSTSSVRACDDVHEEMALAAAREAVKAARIAAQQQPAERADALRLARPRRRAWPLRSCAPRIHRWRRSRRAPWPDRRRVVRRRVAIALASLLAGAAIGGDVRAHVNDRGMDYRTFKDTARYPLLQQGGLPARRAIRRDGGGRARRSCAS